MKVYKARHFKLRMPSFLLYLEYYVAAYKNNYYLKY